MGIELTDRVKKILDPLNEKDKEEVLKMAWYMSHDEAYLDDFFGKGASVNLYDGRHEDERRCMEHYCLMIAIQNQE